MPEENKIRDAADAVRGIAQAIPIYEDLLQPAAKELGQALVTVAKTVHIALAPIKVMVWGYEQCAEYVNRRLVEKLKDVPPEYIITPPPNVAGPLIEALRFTGDAETLREMYANLLATSMDSRTAKEAHPAFVEIIKQLTPDEARIIKFLMTPDRPFPLINVLGSEKSELGGVFMLRHFSLIGEDSGCDTSELTTSYLDNLCRLGLAEIPTGTTYTKEGVYDAVEQHVIITTVKHHIEEVLGMVFKIEREALIVTEFGKQFGQACVVDRDRSSQ